MPRNAAGVYTLPAGNPVVPDTLIESNGWANPTMEDLGAEIGDSLSRDGKGAMRAAMGIVDGSEANPGLRFLAETGSGLYRESDGRWWLVVKGVGKILVAESGGVQIFDDLVVDGTIQTAGGGLDIPGPLIITGDADIVQTQVFANPGDQSENLSEWYDENGNLVLAVEGDGRVKIIYKAANENRAFLIENHDAQALFTKLTEEAGGGDVFVSTEWNNPSSVFNARYGIGQLTNARNGSLRIYEMDGTGTKIAHELETSEFQDYNRIYIRRHSASQSENLHEWRNEAGAVMAAIDKDGQFIGGPGSSVGGNTPTSRQAFQPGQIGVFPLDPPNLGVDWLYCDGTLYPTATYPNLFAYLGYSFGGAGANFNVPDWRGQFLRFQDMGAGVDPDAGSRTNRGDGTTGDNPGTFQGTQNLSHTHTPGSFAAGAHIHSITTGGTPTASPGIILLDHNIFNTTVLDFTNSGGGGGLSGISGASGGTESRPVNVYGVPAIHT